MKAPLRFPPKPWSGAAFEAHSVRLLAAWTLALAGTASPPIDHGALRWADDPSAKGQTYTGRPFFRTADPP